MSTSRKRLNEGLREPFRRCGIVNRKLANLKQRELNVVDDTPESDEGFSADLDEIFEIGAEIDEDRLQQALGGGLGESVRKSIEMRGVDALGWYVTFHGRGVQWGIYIKSSSVLALAVMMFRHLAADLRDTLAYCVPRDP